MEYAISASAGMIDGHYLYIANNEFPNMYCYNILMHEVESVISFPETENTRFFGGIEIKGDLILLIPCSAENAYVVNKETKITTSIRIDEGVEEYNRDAKFISGFIWRDKIILLPASYPGICIYDIVNEKSIYLREWIRDVKERYPSYLWEEGYFRKAFLKGNKIYAPFCGCNCVMILDLETYQYTFNNLENNDIGYSAINGMNDRFVITSRGRGDALVIDELCNKIAEIKINYKPNINRRNIGDIAINSNKIYLLPQMDDRIILINENYKQEEMLGLNDIGSIVYCGLYEKEIVVFDSKSKSLLFIKDNRVVERRKVPLNLCDIEMCKGKKSEVFRKYKNKDKIDTIFEQSEFDLEYFLKCVQGG